MSLISYLWLSLLILSFMYLINNKHILSLMIILEALMLSSIIYMFILFMNLEMNPNMTLVFLTFAAVEASMGLSFLVSYIRFNGNDLILSHTSLYL
uniref:NADH dehydrogenase subunit 4L n=1 Tax=Oreohelix idahoensis TaxID=2584915 RepID=A0A4Y5P333_9EUPU|nr:NADH dehydrogenase subunit 4L [Oreohelix idahoensis]QCW57649.1 NADH dehydrogenase subunit 4L [Oreohelix idahoensis]